MTWGVGWGWGTATLASDPGGLGVDAWGPPPGDRGQHLELLAASILPPQAFLPVPVTLILIICQGQEGCLTSEISKDQNKKQSMCDLASAASSPRTDLGLGKVLGARGIFTDLNRDGGRRHQCTQDGNELTQSLDFSPYVRGFGVHDEVDRKRGRGQEDQLVSAWTFRQVCLLCGP